jgi:cytochrome c-type biogenesis protein CcmF
MELLGRGSLVVALLAAVFAALAGLHAATTRDRRVLQSAERALVACFGATLVAALVLWWALWTHDLRFVVVAQHVSHGLSRPYSLTAFWASQPGSLLLWLLVLTGYSALVVRQNRRRRNRELAPWVTAILGGMASFFALALVVAATPFATIPRPPADGLGLDPSLQNPYMAAHPPMLYLGYVGLSVPFAFAMAALLSGRADEGWIVTTRRWTLAAWAFLGVGMLLGAHWAYEEIGWGGFWGWDAVEDAALMPWLVTTAFLHSVIVQEKKGMLKVWNVSLIAVAYCLSIFGTFLTRSGVLSSVHAFVFSSVGWWFLVYLALIATFAIVVIVTHLPLLRARHQIESVLSREASFLFNNLLLVALAFAILWGVTFPILSRALRGEEFSVSTPFFDFFAVVFGLPLLALAGIGPVIAWRRASPGSVARQFAVPFAIGFAGAVALLVLGYGTSLPGVIAISLCLFVACTIVAELARGTAARRALSPGMGWPRAFLDLVGRNRRRYGGYIVHLAVVVAVIGIVGSMAYGSERSATLRRGQTLHLRNYDLTYVGSTVERTPTEVTTRAVLAVRRNGHSIGTMTPGRGVTTPGGSPSNDVDIRSAWNGEDLYTILDGVSASTGDAAIKVLINPLVNLLWLGGVIFVLGVAITIWPDPREARRLARRYAESRVPGETG